MKFSELSRKDEIGILDITSWDADLSDPRYDSRQVSQGSTFFAIRGLKTDGHEFIRSAIEAGASTIVLEDRASLSGEDASIAGVNRVVVQDCRHAMALLSEECYGQPSTQLRLIGITGTNGKTTVSSIIHQLLEAGGERTGLIGTLGAYLGDDRIETNHTTPESCDLSRILRTMVDAGVSSCVMEVSSHSLALRRVAGLDFDIAVFTNLSQDHLDFHGNFDNYFAAKKLLFDGLKETAIAVTNINDLRGLDVVASTVANVHTFGISAAEVPALGEADLVATEINYGLSSTECTLQKRYSEERCRFVSPLIGEYNLSNLLAAAAALYFGVEGKSLEVLSGAARKLHGVRGRLEKIALKNGATAIVDYAHTPDALEKVLTTLRSLVGPADGSVITVFGCGGDRDAFKRPAMGATVARLSDVAFVTSDNPRSEDPAEIANQILAGIPAERLPAVRIELDRRAAILTALEVASERDVVLVAGKGHETYQVFRDRTIHFDDREEIVAWNERADVKA